MNRAKNEGGVFSEWLDSVPDDPPDAEPSGAAVTTAPLPHLGVSKTSTETAPLSAPPARSIASAGAHVTTEPYPLVKEPQTAPGTRDAVAKTPPSGAPAVLEILEDPDTDAILDKLSYPRPLERVAKSSSAGELAAAHAAGPAVVAAGVKTPPLQAPVLVADSIANGVAPSARAQREAPTVIVRKRETPAAALHASVAAPRESASGSRKRLAVLGLGVSAVALLACLYAAGFFRASLTEGAPPPRGTTPSSATVVTAPSGDVTATAPPAVSSPPPVASEAPARVSPVAVSPAVSSTTHAVHEAPHAHPAPAASAPTRKKNPDPNDDGEHELLIGK